MNSSVFSFENAFYKQIYGCPSSAVIADQALMQLETDTILLLCFSVPIYFRYVYDILLGLPIDKVSYTLQRFNTYHNRLKFYFVTCK